MSRRRTARGWSEKEIARYREGYRQGVHDAAEFAGTFDDQIAHPYRFRDVILFKFNILRRKPRWKWSRGAPRDKETTP